MVASGNGFSDSTFNKIVNSDVYKLEHFDGTNFTCQKDKLSFIIIKLGVAYLLSENLPKIPEPSDSEDAIVTTSQKKLKEDEVRCR